MNRLVAQLLAVARLDVRTDASSGTTNLGEAAARTLSFLAPLAVSRGISVALEDPPQKVLVRGNSALIGELIRNLVENAVNLSPAGTEVAVAVSRNGRLDVMDQGPGIAPEHRERVFERFWRVIGSSGEGSGLGLAIVKEIVDASGARASIADAPGGGALVSVEFLPADQMEAGAETQANPDRTYA